MWLTGTLDLHFNYSATNGEDIATLNCQVEVQGSAWPTWRRWSTQWRSSAGALEGGMQSVFRGFTIIGRQTSIFLITRWQQGNNVPTPRARSNPLNRMVFTPAPPVPTLVSLGVEGDSSRVCELKLGFLKRGAYHHEDNDDDFKCIGSSFFSVVGFWSGNEIPSRLIMI